ncbi:Protein phosphatase 1 regulatory subunit 7 [Picochlorum sp. SENEW3]|nr:Protein phosphatase 1 regulatory subunit 7 [Picochlorum sp. SENEW3]
MKLTPREFAEYTDHDEDTLEQTTKLKCTGRNVTSITGLDVCKRLIRIDLSNNNLTLVDPIAACDSLRWLNVSKNDITSIKPLQSLESLEVLNVSQNKLCGKVGVGRMRQLKALVLNGNDIETVGGLEKVTRLETLIISHNSIRSFGGWISQATSLQKLSASHNPIEWDQGESCVQGLSALVHMKELRLNHTGLRRVPACLASMKRLRILELGSNRIESVQDVQALKALSSIWQLNLKGNTVQSIPNYQGTILSLVSGIDVLDTKRLRPKNKKMEAKNLHLGVVHRGEEEQQPPPKEPEQKHNDDSVENEEEDVLSEKEFTAPLAKKMKKEKKKEKEKKTSKKSTKKKTTHTKRGKEALQAILQGGSRSLNRTV